jgi:DNA-binding beta-propeller fold protein YncE
VLAALLLTRRQWLRHGLGGALALAAFLIVGAPMLWYAATHFSEFQGRAVFLLQEREQRGSMFGNWWDALRMFNYRGNGNDFFVDEPLLEPLAAVLFVAGVGIALAGVSQRRYLFLLVGLLTALIPGVMSVPNANRCITATPFVYMLIGLAVARLAAVAGGLVQGRARRVVQVAVIGVSIAVAAVESYNEFLGPRRRPLQGFSPTATAAGQFIRRYIDTYKIYTVGGFQEYTLTYLTYPGRGDPFESSFVRGTSFRQIEPEIDRYGAKGLLFVLDLMPEGQEALARLRGRFAEHRVEPIPPPRGDGPPVAQAVFVESSAVTKLALWSNFGRSLLLHGTKGGPRAAHATLCRAPQGSREGVSARLRLMLPEVGQPEAIATIPLLAGCEAGAAPLVTLALRAEGMVIDGARSEVLVPWPRLEAGRWYEIYVVKRATDAEVRVMVEGVPSPKTVVVPVRADAASQLAGWKIAATRVSEPGGQLYVDDLTVLNGVVQPGDWRWLRDKRPAEVPAIDEGFEARGFGALQAADGWRDLGGGVTVAESPRGGRDIAAGGEQGGNAFDGRRGEAPGQFDEPMGVALDPAGHIYISERLNHRVQKFASDGSFIARWGRQGEGPGEFREPMDLAADAQALYVADSWNHRVQVFDWNGAFLFEIRGEPTLSSPRGIFARDGRVYLADSGRGCVRVFDTSGKQLLMFGESGGAAPGHLQEPVDLVADAAGRIYVVNSGNNRIEIFTADGQSAGSFPIPGWSGPELKEGYLNIDAKDVIYLSDPATQSVRRFTTDGRELPPLALPRLDFPAGLAVDGDRLIVTVRRQHTLKAGPVTVAGS